jgi:hypothetical protein
MKIPKASSGFGAGNFLGLIFVLLGILLFINLTGYDLPINLDNASTTLQYGAALGSVLGGLSMLFKKKESVAPKLKIE